MIRNTNYYLKTQGIELPDGTTWGAGTELAYRVESETGLPGFLVYEVHGSYTANRFGSGTRVQWEQMRDALNEWIAYQNSIGNKVIRGGEEISEI